jgi:uncharacterized protein YegP (UPF0339 family)
MTLEFYKDTYGEWRWRLEAANGREVSCCGEGYKNRADCVRGWLSQGTLLANVRGLPKGKTLIHYIKKEKKAK